MHQEEGMRVYKEQKLQKMYCNNCGKSIEIKNSIIIEGVFTVDYRWGYFSEKDGKKHSFDLCEKCYNEITKKFKYNVEEREYTEFFNS